MLVSALLDVEHAFKQLEFSIKLLCYCELGYLDKEKFDSDITILLEEETVGFRDGSFGSDQDIIIASQINVSICFGASAMVLDALFEAAKIAIEPESRHLNDELRTLVYMVRCAFAHNPAKACWEARGPFARNISFNLGESDLSINLKSLHGTVFDYSHIGGFANWYKLKEMAVRVVNDS
jgi:hypothetical protein